MASGSPPSLAGLLRTLGELLERGLRDLPPASQLVYLRLAWMAGLKTGSVRCSVDRLIAMTGLSRNTVRKALRDLRERGLVQSYPRERRRPTAWLVKIPEATPVRIPEPLKDDLRRLETRRPEVWLVDRLDEEDRAAAQALLEGLTPGRRRELEAEARERFGELDPEEIEKAVAELVIRRGFGPARLWKYER